MSQNILNTLESTTPQILSEIIGINPELIAKELELQSIHETIELDSLRDKIGKLLDKTFNE